jgi:hypothetical protein
MARKRKSRDDAADERAARVPGSVKFFTALLVILAVGGAAGVKFLKTPRGAVFLADRGAVVAYGRVQRDLGAVMKHALEKHGLRRHIRAVSGGAAGARAADRAPLAWEIPCDESTDLLQVNVSLTEAVEAAGGVVRNARELEGGRALLFEVGTHRHDTHRLTLRLEKPDVIARVIPPPETLPKLALVIDDFGYAKGGIAREMLDLDIPLTIAILPALRHSQAVLTLAREKGRCVMLHLPMEGTEPEKTDAEAISGRMSDDEIAALTRRYVESLPGIDGVNNHQGSVATADERVMTIVAGVLAEKRLFFLDSLTSPKSVAYNAAGSAGLRAARNTMFLDDATERREDVEANLRRLVETALARGSAIGIAHPHPWTFEALRDNLDYLESAGVELVTVCALVETTAAAPDTARTR